MKYVSIWAIGVIAAGLSSIWLRSVTGMSEETSNIIALISGIVWQLSFSIWAAQQRWL
jgi:hypothetical protein